MHSSNGCPSVRVPCLEFFFVSSAKTATLKQQVYVHTPNGTACCASGFASVQYLKETPTPTQYLKGIVLRIGNLPKASISLTSPAPALHTGLISHSIHYSPHWDITILNTAYFSSHSTLPTALSPKTLLKSNQQSVCHGAMASSPDMGLFITVMMNRFLQMLWLAEGWSLRYKMEIRFSMT